MILEALRARATSSAPLVTWREGEARAELSGRTFANGVWKAANYLLDDVGLLPGTAVCVRLDAHWQSPVWQSAALLAGCVLVPIESADALVSFPDVDGDGLVRLAVSRHPLGMPDHDVPPGWLNASADVRACPDAYMGGPVPTGPVWADQRGEVMEPDIVHVLREQMPEGTGVVAVLGDATGLDALVWHVGAPVLAGQPVLLAHHADDEVLASEHADRCVSFPVG